MSDNSKIEWTETTWNPVSGCTKVSAGCDHCYIERTPPFRMAGRKFDQPGIGGTTGVTLHPERLGQPLKWRKPRRIFVNSLADIFHDEVPDDFIARVWAVMAATPQHTYQILTKRHARMRSFLQDVCRCGAGHVPGVHLMSQMSWAATRGNPNWVPGLDSNVVAEATRGMTWGKVLPNVWLGVSVENQQWADIRIPALLETPAAVRWISAEPLLGPVELKTSHCAIHDFPGGFCTFSCPNRQRLDWVVVGGESGRAARPMHPDWARQLRDQCSSAGVPFFFKQWGEWCHTEHMPEDTWRDLDAAINLAQEHPEPHRVGKKRAGRLLDGRTWDEYPAEVVTADA